MHFAEKIQLTLDKLFAGFDAQQIATIDKDLKQILTLLDSSGHQVLILMQENNIKPDEFLADKCLPLIRFNLLPDKNQQKIFLSREKLNKLFTEIPTVEAYIFKSAIETALQKRKSDLQKVQSLLPPKVDHNKPSSGPTPPRYLECFYQLQEGKLQIVDNQQEYQSGMLVYSELSPLQQLEAQRLCKESKKRASA